VQSSADAKADTGSGAAAALERFAAESQPATASVSHSETGIGSSIAAQPDAVTHPLMPSASSAGDVLRTSLHARAQALDAVLERGSVEVASSHQPRPQPSVDEVVQVFHNDGAVAIVIRDPRLRDEVALRCALETARLLAGDSRALRQVTLNGRSIFRSSDSGGTTPARQPRLVSFIC
jgi:hypothetical protein